MFATTFAQEMTHTTAFFWQECAASYDIIISDLVCCFGIFLFLFCWIYLLPFYKNTNRIHFWLINYNRNKWNSILELSAPARKMPVALGWRHALMWQQTLLTAYIVFALSRSV